MKKSNNQNSFADLAIIHRVVKMPLFDRVDAVIDWVDLENEIEKYYKRGKSVDGRQSYSPLILFKMLLLQMWYGLSDVGIEESVRDRISFSKFCGISMGENVPDSTVLCRFRNELNKQNAFESILNLINKRMEDAGLMVTQGVIVDASVTPTPRKPKGKKELQQVIEDRAENDEQSIDNTKQLASEKWEEKVQPGVDTQGAWIKKAGKLHYGYKQHTVSNQDGFVLGIHTTSANQSDTKNLRPAIDKVELKARTAVFADKGYASAENDELLRTKKLKNRILNKAQKNKPLTEMEKQINKKISQTRYKIERVFGSIKRWFRAGEARYVGLQKMHSQHLIQALCYNLYRIPLVSKV
jgi:transposase, IS5 family